MEKHVLVVFPHPDDEAFSTAGLMIQHTNQGIPVTYACATLGEMGRNMGNPFFATRETLPEIRKKELRDACAVMGIRDLRMLGFRDKTLEFENQELLIKTIGEVIDETNPSLVITHYPGYGIHPDHDACGAATVQAVRLIPEEKRPKLYCLPITRDREEVLGEPDVRIDVSDVIDRKIEALKAHRSQTEGMVRKIESEVGNPNSEILNWLSQEVFWIYNFNSEDNEG
ncbi:bacillithiol biosynthesis deacetylase BshB2 [Pseudalkalibacillus caeni]|uniref:Bacillithiol biosynthesis deacetylase BshB2 n=1 Tax=Exobacillus caeni TaxID=2574798 RepID=A0A5R9F6P6_9BACL|nr:bacillithiol biosynthesis deacetylase BshB2 [Pseudalkalibacillus caeni]TLS35455.1 bacillithiol biosynthesis deacetylase BshB2 [Pseudalkalibacillus caeni]